MSDRNDIDALLAELGYQSRSVRKNAEEDTPISEKTITEEATKSDEAEKQSALKAQQEEEARRLAEIEAQRKKEREQMQKEQEALALQKKAEKEKEKRKQDEEKRNTIEKSVEKSIGRAVKKINPETNPEMTDIKSTKSTKPAKTIRPANVDLTLQLPLWKRIFSFFLGLFTIIFSCIGIYSCGKWIFCRIQEKNAEKQQEALRIALPLILSDCSDFSSMDELDNEKLLQIGIWDFLLKDDCIYYVTLNSVGTIVVPSSVIADHIHALLGGDTILEYSSVMLGDEKCYYDSESDCYRISPSISFFSYEPEIIGYDISKDEKLTLTISLKPEEAYWKSQAVYHIEGLEQKVTVVMDANTHQIQTYQISETKQMKPN